MDPSTELEMGSNLQYSRERERDDLVCVYNQICKRRILQILTGFALRQDGGDSTTNNCFQTAR